MSMSFLYLTLSASLTAGAVAGYTVTGILPATPGSSGPVVFLQSVEGTQPPSTLSVWHVMPRNALPPVQCNGRLQQTRANIWEGWDLYLKTTRERIGTVLQVASRHRFEDGTVREGVLVGFPDRTAMWIPRDAVHLLYLICRPNGAE